MSTLSEDQRDELLELAYTVNWYLRELWANPEAKDDALKKNVEMIDVLTGGAYSGNLQPQIPAPAVPAGNGPALRVAIVVGHNSRNKGAYVGGSINQFEFDFNNAVADEMARLAWSGLTLKRFNRVFTGSYTSEIRNVYAQVNAWNPEFILELHFNGYNGKVGYSFMLHHQNSKLSQTCAKRINDIFVKATGFDDKGSKALSPSDRGYLSVASAKAPAVLTEPFFGDFAAHVAKVSELGHDGIASLYLEGIKSVASILK